MAVRKWSKDAKVRAAGKPVLIIFTFDTLNFGVLQLKDYGNEVRGCHSTSEITEDEVIVEVPLKCLITVEMGKETEVTNVFYFV